MKNINIKYLFLSFIISGLAFADMGFFIKLKDFQANHIEKSLKIKFTPLKAQQYIDRVNPNISTESLKIAQGISTVSQCLNIDPFYFMAMIEKESTFYINATSKTYAAGLTQMTGVAIQELRDQLGIRGASYARRSVTKSLIDRLSKCMSKEENLTFKEFYKNHQVKSKVKIKKIYKENHLYALYAGAIVLKVYLAKNSTLGDTSKVYRKALESYNGDIGKHRYAQRILVIRDDIIHFFKSIEL